MKRATIYIAAYCLIVALSIFSLSQYTAFTREVENKRVDEYARVMSNYLWTMNKDSADDFLFLVVNGDPFSKIKITHSDDTLFVDSSFLHEKRRWGLRIAPRKVAVPIHQENEVIGHFSAEIKQDPTSYLIIGLLDILMGGSLFFYYGYTRKRKEFENLSQLATTVLQHAAEGIMVVDVDGKIEAVNPAFSRITGYQPSDVIGFDTSFRRSNLHDGDFYKEIFSTLESIGLWEGEVWRRRKNGEVYPEWLSVTAVKNDVGKVIRSISLFRDITEQKTAEAELIKVRNRLAEAEQIAQIGSWEWKVNENSFWWSDEVYRIFGLNPNHHEASLENFNEIIHPDDAGEFVWEKPGQAENISDRKFNCRIIRPDGELRHIQLVADFQHNADGKLIRLIGTAHDITEGKKTEEILRSAKEKAERADMAKSRFLAAASHDLRQPLQALNLLVAALDQLVKLEGNDLNGRQAGLIGKIERSLESLSDLLNALLDISRLDAGTLIPEMENFPISELLEWVDETYRPKAQNKGLEFVVISSSLTVLSDPQLLRQVVGNLVSNAIRYTKEGKVLIGCRQRGKKITIEVYDTGEGIPRDKVKVIFQEFHQLGNAARRREKGLGLGLAIVDRITTLMGHKVNVHSRIDQGSCFSIDVNVGEKNQEKPEQPLGKIVAKPSLEGVALVIDDDPAVLDSMSLLLSQWGMTVIAALSSSEALKQCLEASEVPIIILADYRLQEPRTGAQAITLINDELKANIPGVIITGDTGADRIQEATASGFRLLHKPLQPANLKTVLTEILFDESTN
ncbi:MAG: PAS domain S-box protein [Alphaproteobacteria bacterium]|nr:PAS domain S-box protein [Alphaproteobacteria bacterium]